MKKLMLSIFVALFMMSACSTSEKGHQKVAKAFTENMAQGNLEEAKKHCTESTAQLIEMLSSMGKQDTYPDYKFDMLSDSIAENKAWVTYKTPDGKEETMELIKEDGKWKVNIDLKK